MKKAKLLLATLFMATTLNSTVLAGTWQQDSTGWWYQNDNGSYIVGNWQWIDGNGDGISECYYFNADGYCLMDTTTPDGNTVNADGAWIVNNVVQTQSASLQNNDIKTDNNVKNNNNVESNKPVADTVWIPATGKKYHSIPDCGRMNPDKARQISLSDALQNNYEKCTKCY